MERSSSKARRNETNIAMKLISGICVLFILACSREERTDQELIQQDLKELQTHLNTEKVIIYKFCKIMMRAGADKDTTSTQHTQFKKELRENFQRLMKLEKTKHLSVSDYYSMFKDYQRMRKYIIATDEDIFPTFTESGPTLYSNSSHSSKNLLKGKAKLRTETYEHAVLSALVLFSRDLGKEVSLYECEQTNPDLLEDSEFKSLILYHRGFIFFDKSLYYLSEDEISKNIEWLNKDKKTDLKLTRFFFGWTNLNNTQTRTAFLSVNHLFRGFDRMMMNREIDEQRSLEDFEKFLELSGQLGLSNEITLSIETYVHLKKGENDKAIVSLTKLKKSNKLSASQKKIIDESIQYLQNREADKVLTSGVYDKVFISKIASEFIFDQLASIDWEQFLAKQKIPYANKIMGTATTFKTVSSKIEKLSNGETLKETGSDIKEKGKDLWEGTKEFVNGL